MRVRNWKTINERHLDITNRMGVTDKKNLYRNKSVLTSRLYFIFALGVVFAFVLISLLSDSATTSELKSEGHEKADYYMEELYKTRNSGHVLRGQNIATATGVSRIMEDTPQGRLLGRRGALTDARRNLLILREKILKGRKYNFEDRIGQSVSGKIAGVIIHSERVVNDLYFLQVDISLDKLVEGLIEVDE